MASDDLNTFQDFTSSGTGMYQLMKEIYPICRSITGDGFRQTMKILQKHIPLTIHEVPSGKKVFDWTIPKEWNIRDAYVKNSNGVKVIDFKRSNLHVLQYSVPVKMTLSLEELKKHLYTNIDHPEWIPYRTSYYKEQWGFCLSQSTLESLKDGTYEVMIDSSLEQGGLTYGEYYIQGKSKEEILLSCHSCHPSLCNDNLSGIVLSVFLAKILSQTSLRYSYRFLFIPGAIGSITWLSLNEKKVSKIKHGLVIACVGDPGGFHYKKSRNGNAEIDQAVIHELKHSGQEFHIREFSPYGYDERQYSSPGFNLPVGSLSRTPHGQFPQYHTSADNLEFVQPEFLASSFKQYVNVLKLLENNKKFINQNPKCEPQLGKRGLYRTMGGQTDEPINELAMLWVLNLSDGKNSLLDIAERSGLPFDVIRKVVKPLCDCGLLLEKKDINSSVKFKKKKKSILHRVRNKRSK
jgi:aminopeptidase-like protein